MMQIVPSSITAICSESNKLKSVTVFMVCFLIQDKRTFIKNYLLAGNLIWDKNN